MLHEKMDQNWSFPHTLSYVLCFIIFFTFLIIKLSKKQSQKLPKPPAPFSLPIIGHLHKLKQPLHRTLQQFSFRFGPIFSLKFGTRPVVVISSPTALEKCFTKNDVILANRPRTLSGKHLGYNWTTIGGASYGPLWRNLRRVATLELLSTIKLTSLTGIREDEIKVLVKGLFGKSREKEFVNVEMRSKFSELSFDIIMGMVVGKGYFGEEKETEGRIAFRGVARDVFELSGASSVDDWIPLLRWIGLGKLEGKMLEVRKTMDEFLDGLICECKMKKSEWVDKEKAMPFIYSLLNLQEFEPHIYSDEIIKGLLMIMVMAGVDTSSVTMEWALSLLLNHPNVLENARLEIDTHVGENRLVEESDLPNLIWIKNIISETLRLFPSVPLLAPHEASEECVIEGYHIQKGTIVLINAWAIHRDINLWDDPLSFKPERFEGVTGEEYRLKLVSFGMGRRACPGAPLANRVIALTLATLIQCFDWKRVSQEDVDLVEGFGLSMPKATPLEVMFKPRLSTINLLRGM